MFDLTCLKLLKARLEKEADKQTELSEIFDENADLEINEIRMIAHVVVSDALRGIAKEL